MTGSIVCQGGDYKSVKETCLMNFTVIKQMWYREDQICMSNHYLVGEWPFGDS